MLLFLEESNQRIGNLQGVLGSGGCDDGAIDFERHPIPSLLEGSVFPSATARMPTPMITMMPAEFLLVMAPSSRKFANRLI